MITQKASIWWQLVAIGFTTGVLVGLVVGEFVGEFVAS